MDNLRLDRFVVAGQESGTVPLPCDGLTAVDIEVHLSGKIAQKGANKPVVVPIWIGEGYGSKTLIRGNLFFGPAPAGTAETTYGVYQVHCSTPCDLIPSGNQPPTMPPTWPAWWPSPLKALATFHWWVDLRAGMLTGGPGPVEYVNDGPRMKLGAGYYDRSYLPGVRWWYKANRVTVTCGRRGED